MCFIDFENKGDPMPRPKKKRSVQSPPLFSDFKPAGVRANDLPLVELALDEFEAIRLADYEGLDHANSAEQMEISRSTFSRLVDKARHKLASFMIDGRRLHIEGGDIHFQGNLLKCHGCGRMFHVAFEEEINQCPRCGSMNLIDLAGGYGHGRCCGRHNQRNGR